jgi:ubiquitin-conjugating enzyme E2 M
MLKLKRLQQQQQAAKTGTDGQTSSEGGSTTGGEGTTTTTTPSTGGAGYVLKKQNSKELLASRKSKSKENVFSLRTNKTRGRKKKTNGAELRATKDVTEMEDIPGVAVDFPDQNNVMNFNVTVTPSDGLYKGAAFKFTVTIPATYPYDPPKVECNTLVYHPNIDWEGHVCLNILRADWMPVLNLGSVLFGLMTLFLEPNPDDPLNKEAAQLMIDKPSDFQRNVDQSLKGGYVLGRQFPKLK